MRDKVGHTPIQEKFEGETKLRHRFGKDFEFYAENILRIAPKYGGIEPFTLNKAQKYIHGRLEKQLKETRKVRALILKARQMGCSTYIAGRNYWKVTKREGVNAYVLSHAIDTTEKLFRMTSRFHENCDPLFRQDTRAASKRELSFGSLDSSYYVGTAGSQDTGRGGTVHFFHGSEIAFWANVEKHFGGIIQSIPSGKFSNDTEIILESTANGVGGKFHEMWQEAESGLGEYIAIFTPWYWQYEYQQEPPMGWDIHSEDNEDLLEYKMQHGLTVDQAYWMHTKRLELGSDWLFKQEFPATSEEAFQSPDEESFLSAKTVFDALIPKPSLEGIGPIIAACDPSRFGKDPTGLGHRQGRRFVNMEYHQNKDIMEVAGLAKLYIEKHNVDRMFIDVNGIGAGVYDRLNEDGYGRIIRPVNYGEAAIEGEVYMNKRAECGGHMRKWIEDAPVEIPQVDAIRRDLLAPRKKYDGRGRVKIEAKDDMRRRGAVSPTAWDVLSMTFAEPVTDLLKKGALSVKVLSEYDEMRY